MRSGVYPKIFAWSIWITSDYYPSANTLLPLPMNENRAAGVWVGLTRVRCPFRRVFGRKSFRPKAHVPAAEGITTLFGVNCVEAFCSLRMEFHAFS